jgi:hypothetical protein
MAASVYIETSVISYLASRTSRDVIARRSPRSGKGSRVTDDPIIEEVRRIRQAHAARFDYDLDRIFADIKAFEAKSSRSIVSRLARRLDSGPTEYGDLASKEESSLQVTIGMRII